MCSTFSIAAKPCIGVINGRVLCQRTRISAARAVTIAPRRRSLEIFPGLSKQGIPLTDLHVSEIVERQSQPGNSLSLEDECKTKPEFHPMFLEEAYERCRKICAEYAKTFYLGSILISSLLFRQF